MSEAAITISGVTKQFATTVAVNNLDLFVPRGSVCGFLGPNGAGKSTTIRMIMSIIYPDSGSIDVLGSSALKNKDRIGYLPEERGVYRKMKVADFLEYMAKLKGAAGGDVRTRIGEWIERVELDGNGNMKCEELSKGNQQKIQFIASVIHKPELLILDEPFSGLDPVNVELIRVLIDDLRREGTTIIFSTHVLHQAELLCDRIFLIHKGNKLLDASMGDIRTQFDPRTLVAEPLGNGVDFTSIDGVASARPMPDSDAMELEMSDGSDPQNVMRDIMAAAPMRRVELRRLSLDEVFIQLVMAGSGHEAARQAREELKV